PRCGARAATTSTPPAASSRARSWTGPAARRSSASGWRRSMRARDALLLAILLAFAATACSRLSFIKPSAERGRYHQVAPDYSYSGSADSRRRAQVRAHVTESGRALDAGQADQAAREAAAALKIDRNSPEALTMMALVEMVRGNSEE